MGDIASQYDALVIGAGPAGLAGATVLAGQGLRVALIDEQLAPGGQIYRAVGASPLPRRAILGDDYWHGATLVDAFARSGAVAIAPATVWQIDASGDDGWRVAISQDGVSRLVEARQMLIATGAQERPVPVPGWTRPGVMTVGAAQVLLKTTGAVPDGKTVLAGCGPLLWLYAAQVLRAGGRIDALLDTTQAGGMRRAARHFFDFLRSDYVAKGLSLVREVRRAVKVIGEVTSFAAIGADDGNGPVTAVAYTQRDGTQGRLGVDTLLVHQGVVPNVSLPNALGCEQRWNEQQHSWEPTVDAWGETSLRGVFVAGDGGGIGGARAAEEQGRLAAWQIAHRAGKCSDAQRDALAHGVRRKLARALRGRAFFEALYLPSDAMRVPQGGTVVCRCEEVTAAQVIDAARIGCSGPNQLKAFLRCGMGPCQGRLCGLTVTELLARESGRSPAETGYYGLRFPTKPLTLAELASLPPTREGEQAVVTA